MGLRFFYLLVIGVALIGGGGTASARALGARCSLAVHLVVTQSARMRLDGVDVIVMAGSVPSANYERVRLVVFDTKCRVLMNWQVRGLESRFDRRRLGGTQFLHFVTMQPAGDGTEYVHRLFDLRGGRPHLRFALRISGKDGFYLGPLVSQRGEGIVTWVGQIVGSMADARPYVITTWRWRGGVFQDPTARQTRTAYDFPEVRSGGDILAQRMRLPYRDQTGLREFMKVGPLIGALNRLEEADSSY